MRIWILVLVSFYACISNYSKDNCLGQVANLHIIYPEYGITIRIPEKWMLDSSSIGINKHKVRVMNINSLDSSGHIYYDIYNYPEKSLIGKDLTTMKSFVSDDAYDIFKPDSILYQKAFDSKDWKTVVQVSVKKEGKYSFMGHIFSIQNTKQIYILVLIKSDNYGEGLKRINCILSSYH